MPAELGEWIETARNVIGRGDSAEDWKVVPTEHANAFEQDAPTLAATLRGSKPEQLAKQYEEFNDQATTARDEFKSTASRADFAIFVTASLGALLLVAGGVRDHIVSIACSRGGLRWEAMEERAVLPARRR